MLHFEHDAVLALVLGHDVRDDVFRERVRDGGIFEGDVVDAVEAVELEHRVKPFGKLRDLHFTDLVTYQRLLSLSKHKDVVVVDIDVIVIFSVLCDAGGDITPGLFRFRDVLEHLCILFSVHEGPFAATCGMICACGYTTQPLNAKCVNPALRRFKFRRFV